MFSLKFLCISKIKIEKLNFTRNLLKEKYITEWNEKNLKTSLNLHFDLTLLSMSHKLNITYTISVLENN